MSKDGKFSPVSVKKLLGICATVWRYGFAQGYLDTSPFEGITRVVRGDAVGVERRFALRQHRPHRALRLRGVQQAHRSEAVHPADCPLLGLPVEEAAGLRVSDPRTEEGIACFVFEPHEQGRLKTASSHRRVAIHPELLRLGLMEYVASRPKHGLLFDLKPGPHGKLSGAYSKWWARLSEECGVTPPEEGVPQLAPLRERCPPTRRVSRGRERQHPRTLSGVVGGASIRDRHSASRPGEVGGSNRVRGREDHLTYSTRTVHL
jgi:hypothetical protein